MNTRTPEPAGTEDEPADTAPIRVTMLSIAVTLFLASTGNTIVTTALPQIVSDLGGLSYISWVVTAYLLASTVAAPIAGKLGDMYGRKKVLQTGIVIFLFGGLICGLAGNMQVLVAGRAVQGLGAGALIVNCMATVADFVPVRQRGRAQGLLSSVFGISTVAGPLLGGALVENANWHSIFFVNFPVGLLAFIVLSRVLKPSTDKRRHRMDYTGSLLLMLVLSTVVLLANVAGSVLAWDSAPVLLLLALVPVAIFGFIRVERRAAEPVLPLDLFGIRNFQAANGVNFLVGMTMFGTLAFMPLYLQVVMGISPTASGMYMVAMMGGLIGTSVLSGRIMSATGRYKILPNLSTAVLVGAMLLMATIRPDTPLWLITCYLFLVGVGIGPTMSVGVISIQSSIPQEHLGVGTASANMFRLTGGSVGTSVFGALFAMGLERNVHPLLPEVDEVRNVTNAMIADLEPAARAAVLSGFSDALTPVFFLGAVVAALACIASLRLVETPLGASATGRHQPAE